MLRVLQVGLGPVGRKIAADLHERGMGRVVGAVDRDPELAGRPLTELVPGADARVAVQSELSAIQGLADADCAVVATSSWLADAADTFRELLARGASVVSTCEELLFPWLHHAELATELDELARRHGGRLLGTGVNPGFLMDALPVIATAVSRDVRAIEIARIQDATTRRLPFQAKIGATLEPAEFERRAATGRFGHAGLSESLHFVAHQLGFSIEETASSIEPLLAERELECGLGPIAPGRVRGLRQVAEGRAGGETPLRLVFVAAIGEPEPMDSVRVHGEPEIDLRLHGGIHGDVATASITLNAIGSLLSAAPGLHTMASLPPVHWRRVR